ncbi:MAG: radical SAM protein [Candidatus Firestonebacteria bacterium]
MIEDELAVVTEKNLIPAWSMVELTYRCNLKCSHCYIPREASKAGKANKAIKAIKAREEGEVEQRCKYLTLNSLRNPPRWELTTKEVKCILDQLAEAGNLFLAFTGGEIFLRKDVFEILEYAVEKRFAVTVLTNTTLLTSSDIKKLKALKIHEISTSIYSLKAGVHDKITGVKGSFAKVMKALKEIKKAGISLRIKTPLMKSNFSEKRAITVFARKNGFKMLFDPVISPKNDGSAENTEGKIGTEVLERIVKQYCTGWKYSKKDLERDFICSAGKNFVTVNPVGEVLSCLQIPLSAGSLRKKSFKEIWQNSAVLNKIRKMKLKNLKECAHCEDMRYCNRCPGLALLENGSLYNKSTSACEIAAIRSRYCNG